MTRTTLLASALLLASLSSGCEPDEEVGRCNDQELATEVVYDVDGFPAYAGQALMQTSCGNGSFCHSQGIGAGNRLGAPHGMDFNMVGSRGDTFDEDSAERLRSSRGTVFEWRDEIFGSVVTGFMPPPDAGDDVIADVGYRFEDGTPLPPVDSAAGTAILQQWLACGPPVVGSTVAFPDDVDPVGDVVARGEPMRVPEPNWSSIYELVIGPRCGDSCHGPGVASQIEESQLDLSDADTAYMELVGVEAEGEDCAGMGTLVVASDPDASLLIDKIENAMPSCGAPMPVVPPLLPSSSLAPIRQWIADGAMDN